MVFVSEETGLNPALSDTPKTGFVATRLISCVLEEDAEMRERSPRLSEISPEELDWFQSFKQFEPRHVISNNVAF